MVRFAFPSLAVPVVTAVLAGLVACNEPPKTELDLVTGRELELQVDALDARLDALDARIDEKAEAATAKAGQADAREKEAFGVYQRVQKALAEENLELAEAALTELKTYTDVQPAMQVAPQLAMQIDLLKQQRDFIGKQAPPLQAEKWFVGESSLDQGQATLLVFWEVWCPHCRREVPKLQATYDKFKGQGLNVVGVTSVDNGKTDEEVMEFINEQEIGYPIAKIPSSMKDAYLVQGVPSAAVVKDGKVLWVGHPATLNDDMLSDWIGS